MSWVDIQDAMHAAIVRASGYPAASVVWAYQNVGERDLPYVKITFGGESALGVDRIESSTDLSRPNGQEIKQEVKGVREVPFDIEVFTQPTLGDEAARRVAERIRTRLRLDSIRDPLGRAGVTPFDPGPVGYVPDIPSANFRGRATCTIRCYVPVMDCLEYVGYIARVRGTIFPVGWTGANGETGFPFDSLIGGSDTTMLPVYYGLAVPATVDETFIKALSGTSFARDLGRSITFSAGDGTKKGYYAFPSAWGTPTVFQDVYTGYTVPNTQVGVAVSVTGDDGVVRPYSVYATVDFPITTLVERVSE